MSDCDLCGLDIWECQCHVHDIEKRVEFLEVELDKLTEIVDKMSEFIKEKFDAGNM